MVLSLKTFSPPPCFHFRNHPQKVLVIVLPVPFWWGCLPERLYPPGQFPVGAQRFHELFRPAFPSPVIVKAEVETLVAARHVHLEVPQGPPQAGEPGFPFPVTAYKYAVVVAEALIEGAVPQAAADDSAINSPALQVAHDPCCVAVWLRELKRLWWRKVHRLGKKRGGTPAAESLHSGDEVLPPHLYEIVQGLSL